MKHLIIFFLALVLAIPAQAETLRTAAGAGYKKVVEQWAHLYEKKTGDKVERIYGNMGQVTAQVKQGGGICLVIGEKSYLSSHGLPIVSYRSIGTGRPVLVTRKGLTLSRVEDLNNAEFKRIVAPDYEKAVYGRAAHQILDHDNYRHILDKTMPVGTVPRSGGYAISGEVDAAFINMTFALANQDKFGSLVELTEGFQPIEIVVGTLSGCEEKTEVKQFVELLQGDAMQANKAAAGL